MPSAASPPSTMARQRNTTPSIGVADNAPDVTGTMVSRHEAHYVSVNTDRIAGGPNC